MTRTPFLLALVVSTLLGACAMPGPQSFAKGSPAALVMQAMGTPTGEHRSAAGGRRLEYATGSFTRRTYMFDFDASDPREYGNAQRHVANWVDFTGTGTAFIPFLNEGVMMTNVRDQD